MQGVLVHPEENQGPRQEVVELPKEHMEPEQEVVDHPEENTEPNGNLIELRSVDEAMAEEHEAKTRECDEVTVTVDASLNV